MQKYRSQRFNFWSCEFFIDGTKRDQQGMSCKFNDPPKDIIDFETAVMSRNEDSPMYFTAPVSSVDCFPYWDRDTDMSLLLQTISEGAGRMSKEKASKIGTIAINIYRARETGKTVSRLPPPAMINAMNERDKQLQLSSCTRSVLAQRCLMTLTLAC